MEKGVLFLTLTAACLWIILDEFFGTKKVSNVAQQLTPNAPNPFEKTKEAVKDFMTWEVGTLEDKEERRKEINKQIEANDGIKTDKAKKALKDAVDAFYGVTSS